MPFAGRGWALASPARISHPGGSSRRAPSPPRSGSKASFVCSDLYELPAHLTGEFDIVYTSRGVLGWLPDIERWAQVAAHFVKPGGLFYITEIHPVVQVFDDDDGATELRLRYPYFSRAEPFEFETQGSYADLDAIVAQEVNYGWNHGLGEIVTALADAGLRIDFLHEFPFVEWPVPFLQPAPDGTYRLPPRERRPDAAVLFAQSDQTCLTAVRE